MEVFKIWSTLNIRGNALSEMEKFLILVKGASKNLGLFQKNLGVLSKEFGLLKNNLGQDNIELKAFGENISSTARRTTNLITKTEKLSAGLKSVAVSGAQASASLKGFSAAGMRGSGGRGGIGGRHFPTHILRESGMGAIAPAAGALGAAGYFGGAPFMGAVGGGILINQGWKSQVEFQRQIEQLRGSGLNDQQLKESAQLALMPTKGISSIGKIKSLNDAFMATRDWGTAKMLAPMLAEAEFAGNATFKNMSDFQRQALVKFSEMRAGSNISALPGAMDLGYRMLNASAGTLDFRQQLQFMKMATGAASHISDRGYAALEPSMQEMSGSLVGTAYQTGYQMFTTGAGTLNNKKRVEDLLRLGIYTGGKKDRNGRYISTSMDKSLLELYETSPVDFVKKIMSIYEAHGTKTPEQISRRFALDFQKTTSKLFTNIMKNMGKSDREVALFEKQPGIHSSFMQAFNVPAGVSERTANAWSSFGNAFGKLTAPAVIAGLNALSAGLENLAAFILYFATDDQNYKKMIQTRQVNNISALVSNSLFYKGFSSFLPGKSNQYGGYSASVIGEPKKPEKPIQLNGNVYLDKKKMGEFHASSLANMLSSGGTISSPTAINPSLNMTPVGLSNYGGQQ